MKKYLSAFMLICRMSIFRIFAVFAAMTAADIGLFAFSMRSKSELGLEHTMQGSMLWLPFLAAFIACTAILILPFLDTSSKQSLRIKLLSIHELTFFAMRFVFCAAVFFSLWAWQSAAAYALGKYFTLSRDMSMQTLVLAFYRLDFFHSLIPLAETSRTVRNFFFIAAMAIECTALPVFMSRGEKRFFAPAFTAALCILAWKSDMASFSADAIYCLICLAIILYSGINLIWRDVDYENT